MAHLKVILQPLTLIVARKKYKPGIVQARYLDVAIKARYLFCVFFLIGKSHNLKMLVL